MPELAAPTEVRFDHRSAGPPAIGVGTRAPRISWQIPAAPDDYVQTGYEIEIRRDGAGTERFAADSGEQILAPWPGTPLTAREAATVLGRVRGTGDWSGWSDPGTVEAGLLSAADWAARFTAPREGAGLGAPAPILTGTIEVPAAVV